VTPLLAWCAEAWRLRQQPMSPDVRRACRTHWFSLRDEMVDGADEDAVKVLVAVLRMPAGMADPWGRPRRGERRHSRWEWHHNNAVNRLWRIAKQQEKAA
jgi:hypothetical protein